MHPSGHIVILTVSLAPEGAVAKVAGLGDDVDHRPARVFDGEARPCDALTDGESNRATSS